MLKAHEADYAVELASGERLYHGVSVRTDPRTGERIDDREIQITDYPMRHASCMTMVAKMTRRDGRRWEMREV